ELLRMPRSAGRQAHGQAVTFAQSPLGAGCSADAQIWVPFRMSTPPTTKSGLFSTPIDTVWLPAREAGDTGSTNPSPLPFPSPTPMLMPSTLYPDQLTEPTRSPVPTGESGACRKQNEASKDFVCLAPATPPALAAR